MTQAIDDVLRRHERDLRAHRNVTSVGIGERDGQPVIIVFVREKVPRQLLRPQDVLPAQIEGHPVDVRRQLVIGRDASRGNESERSAQEES